MSGGYAVGVGKNQPFFSDYSRALIIMLYKFIFLGRLQEPHKFFKG